jgi:hypothetical protein
VGLYVHPDLPNNPVVDQPDAWFQDVGSDLGWLPAGAALPVATMTVAEVVAAVEANPTAGAATLAAERADRNRPTLVEKLVQLAAPVAATPEGN